MLSNRPSLRIPSELPGEDRLTYSVRGHWGDTDPTRLGRQVGREVSRRDDGKNKQQELARTAHTGKTISPSATSPGSWRMSPRKKVPAPRVLPEKRVSHPNTHVLAPKSTPAPAQQSLCQQPLSLGTFQMLIQSFPSSLSHTTITAILFSLES